MTLVNRRDEIDRVEQGLMDALKRHGFPDAAAFAVRLALEEAIVNAFRHGHKSLPASTPVRIAYRIGGPELTLEVVDQGPGFDPSVIKDPTLEENLEMPSGRGLFLMRAYMKSVEYLGRGNHLKMVYAKPQSA